MPRLLVAALLALSAGAVSASGAIVDTGFVADALRRGVLVWDVRSADLYRKGHLPGAVNIGDAGAVLRNANTEDYVPVPLVERILGGAGIDPAREIVVYASRGNALAYFGLQTIRYFGGRKAYVYHDGIDGWRDAGLAVSTEGAKPAPVALKLTPDPAATISTEQMLAAAKRPGVQLVDVRTVGEFTGNDVRAIRGGHIPGALNIPYEMNWKDPETAVKLSRKQVAENSGMALKSDAELRQLYARLDPDKETIVYCQSGVRAAETATVLERLGFRNVKVYDSSWLGYAAVLSAPANNETFFNVGAFNARLGSLQNRIDQLERDLAAARGGK